MATPNVGSPLEEWKDIQDYESLYQISSYGRVRSKKRKSFCAPDMGNHGYWSVVLYKQGKPTRKVVHRLIAIHFLPNPDNKPQVNHIDGQKFNNTIENLEWCTVRENALHASRTGLLSSPERSAGAKVRMAAIGAKYGKENIKIAIACQMKPFGQINEAGELVSEHLNVKAFCRERGHNSKHFFTCLKAGKPYKGLRYKYLDTPDPVAITSAKTQMPV